MATDWGAVLKDMISAAQDVAQTEWPKLRDEAKAQFKILTQVGARIEARKAAGTISKTNARFLMAQHKMAAQNVLFSIEGMTNVLVEKAANAALDLLRAAIKAATGGWVLF